jgi:DNA-binding beta-propeller fold protein YncE
MSAAQRSRVTVVVVAVCCLVPLGYSAVRLTTHRVPPASTAPTRVPPARAHAPSVTGLVLQVTPAPYQLPAPLSREVALPAAGGLLIAGGLTTQGTSTDAVTSLDPVTGATRPAGRLAAATHDAAGVSLAGQAFLFGGGTVASVPAVQAFAVGAPVTAAVVGQLPVARSDATGVTAGPVAYVFGGYDGTSWDPGVLATQDGRHFRVAARLPVPVRYAAVAEAAGEIWVFGGQATTGATNAIQRISPATGQAAVVGRLPAPLQGGAAIVLDGQIYLAGGVAAGATSRIVYRFDPATASVSAAGQLPVPVAYAAGTVSGGVGYLIGGEDGGRSVPTVTTLRLVPAGQAIPQASQAPWLAPAAGPGLLASGSDPSVLPADVLIADHHNNRLLIVDPQGRIRWEFPRPGDLAPGQTFLQPDDAFFSPDGRYIIVTQEDDYVVSVISMATSKIVYRYGVPGVPGAGPDHLFNPDDAMLTPAGRIVSADIKNCRIVIITPPAHVLTRVIGHTTNACRHDPPRRFGSPNGAFPMTDGNYLITEINGDWADEMSLGGAVSWSANPPRGAVPVRHQRGVPGPVPDGGLFRSRADRRVHLDRPPAVADGRVQPALAGPAAAQRRHPAQRRLQPPRLRRRPGHPPYRLAIRPHRPGGQRPRLPRRPGRRRPRPARLASDHPRRHDGRALGHGRSEPGVQRVIKTRVGRVSGPGDVAVGPDQYNRGGGDRAGYRKLPLARGLSVD